MFLLIPSLLLFLASGLTPAPVTNPTPKPVASNDTAPDVTPKPGSLHDWSPCKLAVKGQEYNSTNNPCPGNYKCAVVGPAAGSSSTTRRRRLRGGRGGGGRFGGRSGRSSSGRSSSKSSSKGSSTRSNKPSYQYGKTKSQSFYGSPTNGGRSNIAGLALAGGAGYYLGSSYGYRPYYVNGYHYNNYYSRNCNSNSYDDYCRSLKAGEGRCSAEAARAQAKDCYDYCMYTDYSRADADSYCAAQCGVGSSAVVPKIWISALAVFVLFWSM